MPHCPSRPTRLVLALATAGGVLLAGCASSPTTSDSDEIPRGSEPTTADASVAAPPASGAVTRSSDDGWAARAADVERMHLIGPEAARRLGMRIDWQTSTVSGALRHVLVRHDAVFLLDDRNMLLRLDRTDGRLVWRVPVARELADTFSITYDPLIDRVMVLTGPELHLIDGATGSNVGVQRLLHVANTAGTLRPPYLLYGSRNGMVVWHQYELGAFVRGYTVASSMRTPPVHGDGFVIAVGVDGRMMSIHAGSASMIWSQRALNTISAPPTVTGGVAFIASEDQFIRAYEVDRARAPRWSRLMPTPLTDSPVVIDDRLYLRVPGVGLACFEAFPPSAPGGILHWTAEEANGQVFRRRGNDFFAWDSRRRAIEIVDGGLGALAERVNVPRAARLVSERIDQGDLIVFGDGGEVLRLVPRDE